MYKGRKIIVLIPAFNEETKIGRVVERIDRGTVDTVLVIDDGSTDATAQVATGHGAEILSMPSRQGAGSALRSAMTYARRVGYDVAVIMAGNDKDNKNDKDNRLGHFDFLSFPSGSHATGKHSLGLI